MIEAILSTNMPTKLYSRRQIEWCLSIIVSQSSRCVLYYAVYSLFGRG